MTFLDLLFPLSDEEDEVLLSDQIAIPELLHAVPYTDEVLGGPATFTEIVARVSEPTC